LFLTLWIYTTEGTKNKKNKNKIIITFVSHHKVVIPEAVTDNTDADSDD